MLEQKNYQEIRVDLLVPFANHPFTQYEGQKFMDMVESIRASGVLTPIIVRPAADGKFEILSGHNRTAAATEAGLETIPTVIREGLTDDEAMFIVTETNLIQRSFADMNHSERAVVIAVHYEAIKKKSGYRTDLLEELDDETYPLKANRSSMGKLGRQYGLSRDTIGRYLRVNKLIPALKERLDNRSFGVYPAVLLSYLRDSEQKFVNEVIYDNRKVNTKQARQLREKSKQAELSKQDIQEIIVPKVASTKVKPVQFSGQFLSEFFDESKSAAEIEATVAEALREYFDK